MNLPRQAGKKMKKVKNDQRDIELDVFALKTEKSDANCKCETFSEDIKLYILQLCQKVCNNRQRMNRHAKEAKNLFGALKL